MGSDISINNLLFKKLDVKVTYMIMPWSQCWKMVQSGKMDGALMVSKKKARIPYIYYPRAPILPQSVNTVF